MYLHLAWDINNKGAPDDGSMSETRSRSRQAYEGEVEQWAVERELDLCLDQLKAMHGLIFQGAKCENYPKGNLECT